MQTRLFLLLNEEREHKVGVDLIAVFAGSMNRRRVRKQRRDEGDRADVNLMANGRGGRVGDHDPFGLHSARHEYVRRGRGERRGLGCGRDKRLFASRGCRPAPGVGSGLARPVGRLAAAEEGPLALALLDRCRDGVEDWVAIQEKNFSLKNGLSFWLDIPNTDKS